MHQSPGVLVSKPQCLVQAQSQNTKLSLMLLPSLFGYSPCFRNWGLNRIIHLFCGVITLVLHTYPQIQPSMLERSTLQLTTILCGNVWLRSSFALSLSPLEINWLTSSPSRCHYHCSRHFSAILIC